jgi:hypothetical protein
LSDKRVTNDALLACIPDCTHYAETSIERAANHSAERNFVEALALIADLPLNDAEKADAVRRLLVGKR